MPWKYWNGPRTWSLIWLKCLSTGRTLTDTILIINSNTASFLDSSVLNVIEFFNHMTSQNSQSTVYNTDRSINTFLWIIYIWRVYYYDVIMSLMASQITSLTIVYSTVYSVTDQRKHQSSASLAFVRGVHQGPGNSPHKGPVTRKMFPFDDVIISKQDMQANRQHSL